MQYSENVKPKICQGILVLMVTYDFYLWYFFDASIY